MSELDKLKRWLARRADDLPSPRSPVNRNWAYDWAREATAELGFPVSANRIYRSTRDMRYGPKRRPFQENAMSQLSDKHRVLVRKALGLAPTDASQDSQIDLMPPRVLLGHLFRQVGVDCSTWLEDVALIAKSYGAHDRMSLAGTPRNAAEVQRAVRLMGDDVLVDELVRRCGTAEVIRTRIISQLVPLVLEGLSDPAADAVRVLLGLKRAV
jgi:hypothetical protein